jgi:glycosyltransferase involved in cell wall biosynthesis
MIKEKTVYFLVDSLGLGGSERTAVHLMQLLFDLEGLRVHIIIVGRTDNRISKKNYTIPKHVTVSNILSKNYGKFLKLILTPIVFLKIVYVCKMRKNDIIVSFHDYSNLINVLLKKYRNTTCVTQERKYSICYFGSKNFYMKYYLKFVFNASDTVIVNDYEIKKSLISDYGITSNIDILNNYVEMQLSDDVLKPEYKKVVFITVGRLTKEKNTIDVIHSFSLMHKPGYYLQIIGDGPEYQALIRLVKSLKMEKHIVFLGQIGDVQKYLATADIFVFSSLNEGFPNVVLEAMSCGLPIISYKFKAGITSILENGKIGILVKIGDVNEFALKMQLLAEDLELREGYAHKSRIKVLEYSNKSNYVKEFLRIIGKKQCVE